MSFSNSTLLLPLCQDITFLIPEFYSHVGYIDDQGMPLPPVDDDISFQSVAERSLSPDSAFDYLSSESVDCMYES